MSALYESERVKDWGESQDRATPAIDSLESLGTFVISSDPAQCCRMLSCQN
jgi:hypothetical protein